MTQDDFKEFVIKDSIVVEAIVGEDLFGITLSY